MGWLWTSSKPLANTNDNYEDRLSSHDPTPPQPSDANSPRHEISRPSTDCKQETSTEEEQPSPELAAFLTALRPPPPKPTATSSFPHDSRSESDVLTPRHIHPTSLSCRTLFDNAFFCASLGGQFASVYRYGSLRPCSQQWSDFWFCVRTNRGLYSDEERQNRIMKHEWAKEREKYGKEGGKVGEVDFGVGVGGVTKGLSSEDVWEQRKRLVRGAFGGDYWAAVEEVERSTGSNEAEAQQA